MLDRVFHLYRDLSLAIETEIAKLQPVHLPVLKPEYPNGVVGIEIAQQVVIKLLNIQDESTLLIVIYGFGGIGKIALATSVVAMLNLKSYNYASILLDEDRQKNNLEKLQEQMLRDACPSFKPSITIQFRNCPEGQHHLKEGFRAETKPIFLFIDNVLTFKIRRFEDLLPEDLTDMPKHSRIFLTTRELNTTDGFKIKRESFAMETLQDDHAIKILCNDDGKRELIRDDIDRILGICGGIPLALRMVSGHLVTMKSIAGKCSQILDALEYGAHVKEENLSGRLLDHVYNDLEDSTKEAFLDICCFFNGWIRRHVEYIVGAQEVESLVEAAFVTPLVDEKDVWKIYGGEERLIVHDILRTKGRAMSEFSRYMDLESFLEASNSSYHSLHLCRRSSME